MKEEGVETQRLALELLQKVGGGCYIMKFIYNNYGKDLHEHLPINIVSKVLNSYKLLVDGFYLLERYQFGGTAITNCFGKVNPRPYAKWLLAISYDGHVREASARLSEQLLHFNGPDIYNAPPFTSYPEEYRY